MTNANLRANEQHISKLKEILDQIEESLLNHVTVDSQVHSLFEVGYCANELLQSYISYEERQILVTFIERMKYLQKLYLENLLDERARMLSKELKSLISDEAWRVYLRLEEVRAMELEYFRAIEWRPDFNLDLIVTEQEFNARLSMMKLKTF